MTKINFRLQRKKAKKNQKLKKQKKGLECEEREEESECETEDFLSCVRRITPLLL